jgi:hypothetical protein
LASRPSTCVCAASRSASAATAAAFSLASSACSRKEFDS